LLGRPTTKYNAIPSRDVDNVSPRHEHCEFRDPRIGKVGNRLRETAPTEIAVSVVTEAELWFGVRKAGSRKLERAVTGFLDAVVVLELDRTAARRYGTLRALLESRGTPIGIADTMSAAYALASGSRAGHQQSTPLP
jgi:predicted nucleic acid-binding protein